jgi:hypothetical protein
VSTSGKLKKKSWITVADVIARPLIAMGAGAGFGYCASISTNSGKYVLFVLAILLILYGALRGIYYE